MSRLGNFVARGLVSAVMSMGKAQRLQVRMLAGEVKDRVEHMEPYGFTSCAEPGSEHVTVFVDGDRSHAVTLVVADRRYRLQGLPDGGVAMYDKSGSVVRLNADGTVLVQASAGIAITSPTVTLTGNLLVTGNFTAGGQIADLGGVATMSGMRAEYNAHRHAGSATTDRPM